LSPLVGMAARLGLLVVLAVLACLVGGGWAQNSTRCCEARDGVRAQLACADAGSVIASVDVADYGTPLGYCGAFARGACSGGDALLARLRASCVGLATCPFTVTEELVGPDPCPGTGKKLALQWTCSPGTTPPPAPLPGPTPLRTRGRYIVDANGQRVKLAAVNWCM
jgi:hypothetical protein